jgi:hypothetical protein
MDGDVRWKYAVLPPRFPTHFADTAFVSARRSLSDLFTTTDESIKWRLRVKCVIITDEEYQKAAGWGRRPRAGDLSRGERVGSVRTAPGWRASSTCPRTRRGLERCSGVAAERTATVVGHHVAQDSDGVDRPAERTVVEFGVGAV